MVVTKHAHGNARVDRGSHQTIRNASAPGKFGDHAGEDTSSWWSPNAFMRIAHVVHVDRLANVSRHGDFGDHAKHGPDTSLQSPDAFLGRLGESRPV